MQTSDASLMEILVGALTQTWRGIQERHPDAPDIVLTLGSGSVKLGHFAAARWDTGSADLAELFVGGEGLQRGALGVLGPWLHEAARRPRDMTRGMNW